MTSTAELLERLRVLDVRIALDGERLAVSAPRGALSAELREELARRKDELKAYLGTLPQATSRHVIERAPRSARMPVSHTQQRLWFIKQMNPGSFVYNITALLRFTGRLDKSALERALAELVMRHESLRTRFFNVEGSPYCTIDAEGQVVLEERDFSELGHEAREAAALQAAVEFARRPFDLERSPLLHCLLTRLATEDHRFCLVIDHIIADGLSLGIFVKDLTSLYAMHAGGPPASLPALSVQYYDYAEWERKTLSQGALEDHLRYWKRQLHGLPSLVTFPADRPRPPVQTSRGARAVVQLPESLSAQVKSLARSERATLFMVLLSAFQILLHRFTGETDLPIGSAIANRNRAEVERVIGFFANNIVLRGDLSGNPTVRELLGRTSDMALKAYAHQEMPFDLLVEALTIERSLDRSPLFQVMFVLQNLQFMRMDLPGVVCETMELPVHAARFDLAVDVFDLPVGLRLYFEYNSDLFDAATIERLMDHYRCLLEAMVAEPSARIGHLPMVSAAGQRTMLVDWNQTERSYPRESTLHGLFEIQVAERSDSIALVSGSTQLTYGELNVRANRIAHLLRARGIGREALVGIWMDRSADMVAALLGVLKAGGAYVPLDPTFPRDRIDYMMEDAGLAAVVTESRLAATLDGSAQRAICIDGLTDTLAALPMTNPAGQVGAQNAAYVIYTSGSTGRPKGVVIEHRAAVNFIASMHREPGIGPGDKCVAVTTLSFDIAGLELHGPLTSGGTVVLASRATALDGVELAALLDLSDATLLQATPSTWRLLVESGWKGKPDLKMLCGGEGLPRDLARRLLSLGGELWNMYGPTETTVWSTIWRVSDASRAIPIGVPIANTQVYVLEPSGQPAPVGVAGELCIGGDGLARGYLNREELTAEKFVTIDVPLVGRRRVYRTGDLVRWLADGRLEFIGRRDHQVKVRGFRIELGEIETVLATHPDVKEAVVHVREDVPGDQRLVAYVSTLDGAALDAEAARTTLRSRLPEYMVPNQFVTLASFPLTPNGKVDRRALPAPAATDSGSEAAVDEALMTPVQRQVAAVWRDVLRVDRVGLGTNFFDVGGHSLLLVRLQAGLQRAFGREVPLLELFQHTTVAMQASRLSGGTGASGALDRARARAARQLGTET